MQKVRCIAADFGASSGRVFVGEFDGKKLDYCEVHRFDNNPVRINNGLHWDFLYLYDNLKLGIYKAKKQFGRIDSIGIDTWAVDYGLVDKKGNLLSNPYHYRDLRTKPSIDEVNKIIPLETLYEITGIQIKSFNTIYQLMAEKRERSHILSIAHSLLFIPDLFAFYLTGEKYNEYTNVTTSQLFDPRNKNWSDEIIKKLGFDKRLFNQIIYPGNIIGYLKKDIQDELEMEKVPLIAVGSHDTASAVAATPFSDGNKTVFLSCGTWSLMGIELNDILINRSTYEKNFTNEGGVGGKIRFLKNITGLWIIQQIKSTWSKKYEEVSYNTISELAKSSNYEYAIDPDSDEFVAPVDIIDEIKKHCEKRFGLAPKNLGDIAKASYNGIVKKYKDTIEDIEKITNLKIERINMVGGGIKDRYLCELASKKTARDVVAGPVEATILGNIVVQLIALNKLKDLQEARELLKENISFEYYSGV